MMCVGREERGVNGGIKKWVGRWPKRDELLKNGFRTEMGLLTTNTGTKSGYETGSPSCKKNGGLAMGREIGE